MGGDKAARRAAKAAARQARAAAADQALDKTPIPFPDLEPQFIRHAIEIADEHLGQTLEDGTTQWGGFPTSVFWDEDDFAKADGVRFLCPLCFKAKGGPIGTHSVRVYFEGSSVPEGIGTNKDGQTVRWKVERGADYHDLSLAPSIQIQGGCNWHGYITAGEATFC